MAYEEVYQEATVTREELERLPGPVLVEFGANWCGICAGFAPVLKQLMQQFPDVRHIKVEDGPGKALGRSFRVKLWPNLVFLRDGQVVAQFARPSRAQAQQGLKAITLKA